MAVVATKLNKGQCIRHEGDMGVVLHIEHRTPGKGNALIAATIRSFNSGNKKTIRFSSSQKVDIVETQRQKLESSYSDPAGTHFMNLESYDEVRGYLHSAFAPECVHSVQVNNLTHFGQPYNGSTRYFKPTLFVAAVRAGLGRPTVLHGVDAMPPKWGVTDEQILSALNARTNLSLTEASERLENPDVGFAYISQREYAPAAYAARDLRAHIGKRPP